MLSKEEIEKYKKTIRDYQHDYLQEDIGIVPDFEMDNALNKIFKYIEHLETNKQKLIEKLEKDKFKIENTYSQINGNYFMAQDRLDLINEILEIVKGEK